jgi:hypothetical protein
MTIVRRAQAPRLGPLPSLGREAGARALTARIARRTRSITSNEIAKPPTKPPRPSSPRTTRRDLECTAPLPRAGGAGGGRRSHRNVSQHSLPIHRNVSQHSLPIHPTRSRSPPTKPPRPSKHCSPPACGRGRGRAAVPAQHLPAQPPNPPQRDHEAPDQTAETFKALPPSRVREGPGEGGGPRATSPSTASQSTPTRSRSLRRTPWASGRS